MGLIHERHRAFLETESPTAFLLAGGLMVAHVLTMGVQTFTAIRTPEDFFTPVGYLLGMVGLVGIASLVADQHSWTARAVAVLAAVSATGWAVIVGVQFGELTGVLQAELAVLPVAFFVGVLLSTLIAYGLLGMTAVRAEGPMRTVGRRLLVPPFLLLGVVLNGVLLGGSPIIGFGLGVGLTLAHFAIGFALRTELIVDHRAPTADPTVG